MTVSEFLGKHVSDVLASEPLCNWSFERSSENDLDDPVLFFVFGDYGVELQCDRSEHVNSIFLEESASKHGILEVPFSYTRQDVRNRFGEPSSHGPEFDDSVLGKYGQWDRYDLANHAMHIEFRADKDAIKCVTLMTLERASKIG